MKSYVNLLYIPSLLFLEFIKIIVDSILEISRYFFSNQAIKAIGKASSYSDFLSNT